MKVEINDETPRKGKSQLEEGYKLNEAGEPVPDYDHTIKFFEDGDVIKGTIVRIDRDEVLVDVGYKSEGVIPNYELSIRKNCNPNDVVQLGQEIEAFVLQKEDSEGRLLLSKKRAEFEKAWQKVQDAHRSGSVVEGTAIEVVKGGLILDVGVRGFLPASLIDINRVKELDGFIGQKIECKIIELNRQRNNVVLSRKAVLQGEIQHEKAEIIGKITKGQILNGKISSIVDFGAFVDLGGLDGLIHISELSWSHVDHPSEVVSVGDEVKVQVLDVDKKKSRVSLGLKQTQEDHWLKAVEKLNVGEVFKVKVIRILPFGVFVQLGDNLEGLIHISELSTGKVVDPHKMVKVGDTIQVKLLSVDKERRRISLSLKQAAAETEESKQKEPKEKEAKKQAAVAEEKAEEQETKERREVVKAEEAKEKQEPGIKSEESEAGKEEKTEKAEEEKPEEKAKEAQKKEAPKTEPVKEEPKAQTQPEEEVTFPTEGSKESVGKEPKAEVPKKAPKAEVPKEKDEAGKQTDKEVEKQAQKVVEEAEKIKKADVEKKIKIKPAEEKLKEELEKEKAEEKEKEKALKALSKGLEGEEPESEEESDKLEDILEKMKKSHGKKQ